MSQTLVRPSPVPGAPLQVAGATDRGRVRELNEDAILVEAGTQPHVIARGSLCAVADGMGGHAAGEVASQLAVATLRSVFYGQASDSLSAGLVSAITSANLAVWEQAQAQPSQRGMGCTLTAAAILDGQLAIGHVGDSRAYLVRNRRIAQVTADHSWVAEQLAAGNITPEQARNHAKRNLIRRALGYESSVEVDVFRAPFEPGDLLLLCSDGLTTVLTDEEIGVTTLELSPERAVDRLIRQANARGAADNVSVVIAYAPATLPVGGSASAGTQRSRLPMGVLAGGAGVGLVLLAAGGVAVSRLSAPSEQSAAAVEPPVVTAVAAATPAVATNVVVVQAQPTAIPTATAAAAAPPAATSTPPATTVPTAASTTTSARTGRISDYALGGILRETPARTGPPIKLYFDTQVRILGEQSGENYEGSTLWYRVQVLTGDFKDKIGFVHSSAVAILP